MKKTEKAAEPETTALPAVTVNFGDGSAPGTGVLGEAIAHRYAVGTYTCQATGTAGNGKTKVTGPGMFDIVVTETPLPPPAGARPVVTAANRTIVVAGPPVEYESKVTNATGTSNGCTIASTMSAAGITPESILTEYDADDAGTWTELPSDQDGVGKIKLRFGSGFTIGPGYDQTTKLRQSIPTGSPIEGVGTVAGRQEVHAGDGSVIGSADYTITVTPEV